jgi:hypothetical protein
MADQQYGNEFRVRAQLTASLAFGLVLGITVAVAVAAAPLIPAWSVGRNVVAGCEGAAVLIVVSVLLAFRDAIFRSTMILATPGGLHIVKRKLLEPWDNIAGLSIGTSRFSGLALTVDRAVGADRPLVVEYSESYDEPWHELFRYIREVAPHVRLTDGLRAARAKRD